MKETFYRTGIYKVNHSEFSGRICASDFDRKTTLSEAAARIMSDRRFDRQCQQNITDNRIRQRKDSEKQRQNK